MQVYLDKGPVVGIQGKLVGDFMEAISTREHELIVHMYFVHGTALRYTR